MEMNRNKPFYLLHIAQIYFKQPCNYGSFWICCSYPIHSQSIRQFRVKVAFFRLEVEYHTKNIPLSNFLRILENIQKNSLNNLLEFCSSLILSLYILSKLSNSISAISSGGVTYIPSKFTMSSLNSLLCGKPLVPFQFFDP